MPASETANDDLTVTQRLFDIVRLVNITADNPELGIICEMMCTVGKCADIVATSE